MESSNVTLTTPYVPCAQAGLYYNLSLGNKSSLGAELLFAQIEGKEKWKVDFTDDQGNTIGHSTALFYRHISYLSLPLYYGYTINRTTFHVGFQVSYALGSSGREKNDAIINEIREEQYSYNRKVDDINIEHMDFGPRSGIIYQLSDKLAVEGTYYYGIPNIQKSDLPWESKIQQITLGIRYALWNKEVSK